MNFINILKKQNGNGIRKSNILDSISNIRSSFVSGLQTIKEWDSPEKTFFRDDYSREVNYILNKIPKNLAYNDYSNWFGFFLNNPNIIRRIFQHLYTYDNSHEIYNHIKKSLSLYNQRHNAKNEDENKKEREKELYKFVEKIMRLKHELMDQIDPNFGACEECLKIKWSNKVRNHKKTIEDNPKLWDWTKW